jgi:hypothetical protein
VLSVSVLKRRGPPLPTALRLDLPPVLSAAARGRARLGVGQQGMGQWATQTDVAAGVETEPLHAATFVNLASS